MAFEIRKIDPLDLQPRKAVGVNIPFQASAVFEQNFQTKDAIKTNLINYLLTGRGERYLNPNFGSGLRDLLFEQLTESTLDELEARIQGEINFNFPKVDLTKVDLLATPDSNQVQVSINYRIIHTDVEDNIIINIEQ